eukprot:gene31822-7029_t
MLPVCHSWSLASAPGAPNFPDSAVSAPMTQAMPRISQTVLRLPQAIICISHWLRGIDCETQRDKNSNDAGMTAQKTAKTANYSKTQLRPSLIQAAYLLDLCTNQHGDNEASCATARFDNATACQWSSLPLSGSGLPTIGYTPVDPSYAAFYLGLTSRDNCQAFYDIPSCASDSKCSFQDHFDHGHCMVYHLYVQKLLGGPDIPLRPGQGSASDQLAAAANAAQQLCATETVWFSWEEGQPPALGHAACEAKGSFQKLSSAKMAQLARAAGVTGLMAEEDAVSGTNTTAESESTGDEIPPAVDAPAAGTAFSVTVPQCECLGPTTCIPSLLSLSSLADAAAQGASSRTRELLSHSLRDAALPLPPQ